jgi:nucleoside-diphosphate-sugar epimerase
MKDISPQMIFHVAALGTAVGRNPFTIDEFIATNTLGTIHLIDAAREV